MFEGVPPGWDALSLCPPCPEKWVLVCAGCRVWLGVVDLGGFPASRVLLPAGRPRAQAWPGQLLVLPVFCRCLQSFLLLFTRVPLDPGSTCS